MKKYDFSGWATRNDVECSDGRIIRKDAFKDCDGKQVPMVWMHDHSDPYKVIGHAMLENRDEGVYAYCSFNNSEAGQVAKEIVKHEDVNSLSIYANNIKQIGSNVIHGAIRELSLVLAGANPEAIIETVFAHDGFGDDSEEGIIRFGMPISIAHSDESEEDEIEEEEIEEELDEKEESDKEEVEMKTKNDIEYADIEHAEGSDETVQDVIDSMDEKQKNVMYWVVGQIIDQMQNGELDEEIEQGDQSMKKNIFQGDEVENGDVISHSEMAAIISDAKAMGQLSQAVISHGIEDIEFLFPDDKNIDNVPTFIQRDQGWVSKVMGAVHHTPFSRIKSMHADITGEEARALGYMKGKLKKEEVFSLLKRSTDPQTVYKKQKMDRDDVIDITDFDVVAWIKGEMRVMLDEEIARAILIGDGRLASSDDKIHEDHIRPIWKDAELYTVNVKMDVSMEEDPQSRAKDFIKKVIKARKHYKGSGNPALFTTEDMLSDLMLIEDNNGRMIYESEEKLRGVLRVSEIITVPVMEDQVNENTNAALQGIIVNLKDYNVGADKGGAVNMFDDFDIDYNAMKYLIETRCSGALTRPFSALVIESPMTVTTAGGDEGDEGDEGDTNIAG